MRSFHSTFVKVVTELLIVLAFTEGHFSDGVCEICDALTKLGENSGNCCFT